MNESVLCIERNMLPAAWLREMAAVSLTEPEFSGRFPESAVQFIPRDAVETDPSFKQIIPYLLIRTASGRYGCYQRRGTEERLHDLWSVGIGGHVTSEDRPDHAADSYAVIRNGLLRELSEELRFLPTRSPDFLGVVNEERTGVGSVHMGLVFRLEIDTPEILQPGEELSKFRWVTRSDLERLCLEYWSQLALKLDG